MPQSNKSSSKIRMEIVQLAAKIVAESGANDYLTAKKKAANQLGAHPGKNMPTNLEVEQALIDYQGLFQNEHQSEQLYHLRTKAIKAMRLFNQYQPRLVGPVLTGTATKYSDITLHLISDEPEQIGFHLDEHAIPFTNFETTIKISKTEKKDYPAYQFIAEKTGITLVIFPEKQKYIFPFSTITGKPMQRATINEVEKINQELEVKSSV